MRVPPAIASLAHVRATLGTLARLRRRQDGATAITFGVMATVLEIGRAHV